MLAEFGKLLQALAFFSRVPLPNVAWRLGEPWRLDQCARWFAIAGLLIALIPAAVLLLAGKVLPMSIAAGLALAAGLLATGAVHEDGLSDTADGLGGASTRERALEIMRDSAIGSFGAAALVFSIGLRWAALAALPPLSGAAALLIAHSSARAAIVAALAFSSYARSQGTGSMVAAGVSPSEFGVSIAIALLLALLVGGTAGLLAALAGLAGAAVLLWYFHSCIGGYTGDGLGAMEQFAEITILLVLAGAWNHP